MARFGTIEECQGLQSKRYSHQRSKESPAITVSSVNSPSLEQHQSHTDILSDLDMLRIEGDELVFEDDSGCEAPEHKSLRLGYPYTHSTESVQATKVEKRIEKIVILPADDHFATVFNVSPEVGDFESRRLAVATVYNVPAKIEDYEARRRAALDAFQEQVSKRNALGELDQFPLDEDDCYTEEEDTENQPPTSGPLLNIKSLKDLSSPPENQNVEGFGPRREMITKDNGSRFVVTNMHHIPESSPINQGKSIHMPFGTFRPQMLKIILLKKLQRGIPLDRLTFTGDERYPETSTCLQPSPLREEMHIEDNYKSGGSTQSEGYSSRRMMPEDWHYILTVCDDEDWDDFDGLWREYITTVEGDFLCKFCDVDLPRPGWMRVEELRRGFE
ncbi:hypothetical protein VTL71DRAFT_9322 [Oculimacula yallundae]|uniref:Uncharacterized protein n=1 Tax=Oculimacula yallundae TaxID=86028 RepID=A0ABR4BTZ4_9HELO